MGFLTSFPSLDTCIHSMYHNPIIRVWLSCLGIGYCSIDKNRLKYHLIHFKFISTIKWNMYTNDTVHIPLAWLKVSTLPIYITMRFKIILHIPFWNMYVVLYYLLRNWNWYSVTDNRVHQLPHWFYMFNLTTVLCTLAHHRLA